MTILNDEEIYAMADDGVFLGNIKEITRTIESAVIEKIKARGAEVWKIRFQSPSWPDGLLTVHYHGINAIADYRDIDPGATATLLYRIED